MKEKEFGLAEVYKKQQELKQRKNPKRARYE